MPELVKVLLWDSLLTLIGLCLIVLASGAIMAIWSKASPVYETWRMRRALEGLAMWRARKKLYSHLLDGVDKSTSEEYPQCWQRYEKATGQEAKYLERTNIFLEFSKRKADLKDDSKKNN